MTGSESDSAARFFLDWTLSRRLTTIGGGIGLVSLVLPWFSAKMGNISANGLSSQLAPLLIVAALVALGPPLVAWGDGWGRLSSLLGGIGGIAMAGLGGFVFTYVSRSYSLGRVTIEGQDVPVTAIDPGFGLMIFALSGVLVVFAALTGLINSFR